MSTGRLSFEDDGIQVTGFEQPRQVIPPEVAQQQHPCMCSDYDCKIDCVNGCDWECPNACWTACAEDPQLTSSAYSSEWSSSHSPLYSDDKYVNWEMVWLP